ncbi:MAG: hypothetical protein K6E69_03835 [Treponema sp.]|uniref:hypothetical protein n=1 Tax=Treponema sp. TaxID=166 RepID=UPI00298E1B89|nr:hypothetical protein [Treponema sp.]MCR5386231.1 hypothetical protein [Treponema sp.]
MESSENLTPETEKIQETETQTTQVEQTSQTEQTAQTESTPAPETAPAKPEKTKKTKKRNPFVRFILAILKILAVIIIIIALWCTFSALDRKKSVSMIPADFSVYMHTDSVYDCINPLIDLQAADIFLSAPDKSDIRGIVMSLRESEYRNNPIVKILASRKIDAALYTTEENSGLFVASIDFGVLSSITRLTDLVLPRIQIEDLYTSYTDGISYYEYKTAGASYYFKPVKNLIIASNDLPHFMQALRGKNDATYTKAQLDLFKKKVDEPVKLIIDAKKLAVAFTKDNELLNSLSEILSPNLLSLLTFKITDSEINLNIEVPTETSELSAIKENYQNTVQLLSVDSTAPSIVTRMSSSVQYYTLLNIGTLGQLKEAFFPMIDADTNINGVWSTANGFARSLLGTTLDDLLFSWSGKELAVLGIEGLNDPVFAIQIADESKRKEVFETAFDSFLIKENKSLILNGVRIPRLELPGFLQNILKILKISLPKPYYLVYNNYVFFSQSAESISTIYSTFEGGTNISHNPNYKMVADKKNQETGISLFYDLERSRPFFINSNSSLSQILELYTIGKTDFVIKKDKLIFKLNAASRRAGSLKNIPGFPMDLSGEHSSTALNAPVSKPSTIFWVENGQLVKALDAKKTKISSYALPAKVKAFKAVAGKQNKEQVIILTEDNEIYLLSSELELEKPYPVKLSDDIIDYPYFAGTTSYVPFEDGTISKVVSKSITKLNFNFDDFSPEKSTVFYDGKAGAIYEKGFLGKLYIIYRDKCINADNPIMINKIGFGVPAVFEVSDNLLYTGFISQSGDLSIYKIENNSIVETYADKLDGLFYTNLIAYNGFFYALSSDGQIFKINIATGDTTSIQLDNVSTKESRIYIQTVDNRTFICVGIDGNMIYAFTENLELMPGFPVAGTGIPAFADVNGDGYLDCFALTIDNKINAWNLR